MTGSCFPGGGGDRVVVVGDFTARLRTGATVGVRLFVHVWEFTGARATRFLAFEEDGPYQRALGLSDDAGFEQVFAAMMGPSETGDEV